MFTVNAKMKYEAPVSALERWNPSVIAAAAGDETTMNIYGLIGQDWDGTGTTVKMVSDFLAKADGRNVTININSPGGDFFEGNAIYNLFREYSGEVCIRVVGLAASAASLIAMAGDKIEIAESGFFMIHNAWSFAIGNRHDMATTAAVLEKFDLSMTGVYSKKTGISAKKIAAMMDAETWISGEDAVDQGFADGLLDAENLKLEKPKDDDYNSALRKLDVMLAKAMVPRSERRALIKDITTKSSAKPSAGDDSEPTPSAGDKQLGDALAVLLSSTSIQKE